MTERQIIKIVIGGLILFSGCYYDSAEKLYPSSDCITVNMSYQTNIVPILERNCYACHGVDTHNGNVTLQGYDEFKKNVLGDKLLGSIRREPGYKAMPQSAPKMSNCEISQIEQWINEGALNN